MKTPLTMAAAALAVAGFAAQRVDGELAAYVNSIRAIDNHAHVVSPDVEHDTEYDALLCDALPPGGALPPAVVRDVPSERRVRLEPHQILDRAGIDVAFANRIAMAPSLKPPRFRWVPYADALLFPLDNGAEKARSQDRKVFYERQEALLQAYLKDGPVNGMPSTLDHYLEFIAYTLQQQRYAGAVAITFETAHLRSLEFAPADRQAAIATFARHHGGGIIDASEYKNLQDFLFRIVAAEAGRNGLAVQIHTGAGCGDDFDVPGSAPLLLSSALNDPSLRSTTFVLLHGAAPFDRTVAPLILRPNVYVDVSVRGVLTSPAQLALTLRPWLESMPEHVLFGTDASPSGPGYGWEETTLTATRNTRRALAIVLTEMVADKTITKARAREIARRVLRDNAVELYRLGRATS